MIMPEFQQKDAEFRISSRSVRSSPLALQAPRAAQVTVELACFSTPRATMHICTASHTTSVATAPDDAEQQVMVQQKSQTVF